MLIVGGSFLRRLAYLEKKFFMDTMQTPPPPNFNQTTPVATAPGLFGSKIPSTVAFAVGILLFLLPFSEIKCNNTSFAEKSGLSFVLGSDWKSASSLGGDETTKDVTKKTNSEKEGNAQYFAIAALGLALLGLLLSFGNNGIGGMITGVLSAGALIGVMIEVKKWFNAGLAKEAADKAKDGTDTLGMGKLGETMTNGFQLSFTPWFYIAIIAFLAAAFFCYMRMKAKRNT